MKAHRHRICFLGIVILLTSCATAPPPAVTTHRQLEYDASFEEAWDAVIEAFAEHNIPIDNMEKDSGIITTDWFPSSKDEMDCGSAGFLGYDRNRKARFNVFVHDSDSEMGRVEVQVNTAFQASRYVDNNLVGEVECSGKGILQKKFHDAIQARL